MKPNCPFLKRVAGIAYPQLPPTAVYCSRQRVYAAAPSQTAGILADNQLKLSCLFIVKYWRDSSTIAGHPIGPIWKPKSARSHHHEEPRRPRFAEHQIFSFRYGWRKKGYCHICSKNKYSNTDDFVHLGVSKNIVENIRFWCIFWGLTAEESLTTDANTLCSPLTGWDPTLRMMLPYGCCTKNCITSKIFMVATTRLFGEMHKLEFNQQGLLELLRQGGSQSGGKSISVSVRAG